MTGFFAAGRDLVRWEVEALGRQGPYRLTLHHARGTISEYFNDVAAALGREEHLERMLVAAATHDTHSEPAA
jgi:hypothetical protein